MESRLIGNPSFYLLNRGASLKPPWPEPSLGKKDQVRKKSTPGVTSIGSITIHIQLKLNLRWDPFQVLGISSPDNCSRR